MSLITKIKITLRKLKIALKTQSNFQEKSVPKGTFLKVYFRKRTRLTTPV